MKKVLTTTVPLLTPIGKKLVRIKIVYDDPKVIDDPKSEIILVYDKVTNTLC